MEVKGEAMERGGVKKPYNVCGGREMTDEGKEKRNPWTVRNGCKTRVAEGGCMKGRNNASSSRPETRVKR